MSITWFLSCENLCYLQYNCHIYIFSSALSLHFLILFCSLLCFFIFLFLFPYFILFFFQYSTLLFFLSPVGWGCRIYRLHFYWVGGKALIPPQRVSWIRQKHLIERLQFWSFIAITPRSTLTQSESTC